MTIMISLFIFVNIILGVLAGESARLIFPPPRNLMLQTGFSVNTVPLNCGGIKVNIFYLCFHNVLVQISFMNKFYRICLLEHIYTLFIFFINKLNICFFLSSLLSVVKVVFNFSCTGFKLLFVRA